MNKVRMSWETFQDLLAPFDQAGELIYGVPKGGMIAAGFLQHARSIMRPKNATLILDDIIDSGATEKFYTYRYPHIPFGALLDRKNLDPNTWIVFPWEADHPAGEDTVQQNIVRQLQHIGEDPKREGLRETPNRIVRSWGELYAGYQQDPKDLFKTFAADGYNEMILLKDIEMYSMCEHHMLPFFGKAHVAYIPNDKVLGEDGDRVAGISKLARLVDIYSRRLQIQERICEQVSTALMAYLKPKGAACIIEAQHLCMQMRGCGKQHSVMVTSSLKGVFLDNQSSREELMSLIK